jgi:cation:H+ antiporter
VVFNVGVVALGAVLLWVASARFVSGAVALSVRFALSPVLVGALVIGFGTSAPELLASALAAASGELDIAVGNAIGSNTANLSLVLGAASLMTVVVVPASVLRREAWLCLAATGLFAGVLVDGRLTRVDGAVLSVAAVLAVVFIIASAGSEVLDQPGEADTASPSRLFGRCVAGLVGTVAGAQALVSGSSNLADAWGLTGGVVGVSLVALGTSLPEIATSLHAVRRGQTELIIGNVLGSNVFNSLMVGAAMALIGPGVVAGSLASTANLLMMAVTVAALAVMVLRRRVGPLSGAMLVAAYVALVVFAAR